MAFCGGRLKQQSRSALPYKQDIYMWLVPYGLKQVTPSMFPGCKYSISSRAPMPLLVPANFQDLALLTITSVLFSPHFPPDNISLDSLLRLIDIMS
jgi:hypothetical protein